MCDLEKCILESKYKDVYIISGLSGRFDHTLNNLSLIYKYGNEKKYIAFRLIIYCYYNTFW